MPWLGIWIALALKIQWHVYGVPFAFPFSSIQLLVYIAREGEACDVCRYQVGVTYNVTLT